MLARKSFRFRLPRICLLAVALDVIFPAVAAEPEAELESVRVRATRSTLDVENTPRTISVIEKEQVEERPGGSGIQSILSELPGISYARSGGLGGQIIMRGFNSNTTRSMLAIDGDRYRGRSTLEFNMIDPNTVERIEVIRGPASVLWGADAMNGVVNVITRRSRVPLDEPFSMKAQLRAVDFNSVNDMWGGRAELTGGGNGFDVLVGAFARDAGDFDTPKGRAENSGFRSHGVDFRIGYTPFAGTRFELAGRYQQTTSERAGGLGAAPGSPYLKVKENPIKEQYLKLGAETRSLGMFADLLEGSVYLRKFRTDIYQANAANAAGTLNPVTTNTQTQVYEPTIYGGRLSAAKGVGNHLLSYGADFYKEDFGPRYSRTWTSDTATGAQLSAPSAWRQMERGSEQSDFGVYLSDEWKVHRALMLSGAVRLDRIHTVIDATPAPGESAALQAAYANNRKTTETPVTGSIGAVWHFTSAWSATVLASRGFRAASGNERTLTSSAGTILTLPSPELDPERNTTYEAGLRYRGKDFRLDTTVFRSEYKDLIMLAVVSPTLRQRMNVGKARISGIEADAQWRFAEPWLLRVGGTWTRATDVTTHTPLEGVPELAMRTSLRYGAEQSPWYVEGVVRGAVRRNRVSPASERPRAGYAMFDAYFGADLGKVFGSPAKGWKLVAGVENMFNRTVASQSAAEDLRYINGLIGNPLLEPGRAFVAKLVHDY
jgi:hemoglobin/transferrin/lactoferrin receptor protein